MSAAAYLYEPAPVLTAQRGGLAPAPVKMHPSEIALTLSADVLRLPYTPATRLVLAEVVSLFAATGCCDASNPHFMARLSLKHDVVNEAIQRLHEDGLLVKVVNKAAGFYRTLTPVPAAIAAKASTNPYPEKPTTYSEKPTGAPSRKSRLGQSEIPTSPSRENPLPLVGNPDTNTPLNLPVSFQEDSTPPAGAGAEKKMGEEAADLTPSPLPADEKRIVPPVARPPQPKAASTRAKPEPEPAHFADFWAAWPKKEKRQEALAAFQRLPPDDQAAAASRADTWLLARPDLADPTRYRYIPLPASWLNQTRWTDQAPTTSPVLPHATANQSPHSARPVNGHKSLGHGGTLARLLAESD